MDNQKKAYLYAMMTVLLWATVASAFKITLRFMTFFQMLLWASFVSMAALLVIILLQGKWRLLTASKKGDYLHSAVLGFLNPFLYYLILFKAYSLLPAQEAQPLNWTWPIMLVLLSTVILGQRVRFATVLAILVSFSGVLVISTRGDILGLRFSNPTGALLALSSSLIWALYWLYNVKDNRDDIVKLFLNFSFGFLFTLLAVLLFSEWTRPALPGLLGSIYIGLFEMGITFVFWLKALSLSRTTAQVSHLIYLSPFLSLFVIHFAVGEAIIPSTIIGLALIVAGVIIQELSSRKFRDAVSRS
jgi:drug/metabolite transporter (DMT)-like permease